MALPELAIHREDISSLALNENPLGASRLGAAAFAEHATSLHRYPDPQARVLIAAIAERHDLSPTRIACGRGAEQLLALVIRAMARGARVVAPSLSFKLFEIAAGWADCAFVEAPLDGFRPAVDAIIAAACPPAPTGPPAAMVVLANPNNPTGQALRFDELVDLRSRLPEDTALVVDQVYAEIDVPSEHDRWLQWCARRDDTIVIRSFSKSYGLAGARVGWMVAPESVIDTIGRLRCPFVMSEPAMAAARAALGDEAHVAATRAHCDRWRPRLTAAGEKAGLRCIGAAANFVCFVHPHGDAACDQLCEALLRSGTAVCRLSMYAFAGGLRISVGTTRQNEALINALAQRREDH